MVDIAGGAGVAGEVAGTEAHLTLDRLPQEEQLLWTVDRLETEL